MFTRSLHSLADLSQVGLVQENEELNLQKVSEKYPLSLTPNILTLISLENSNGPIARQFIPSAEELLSHAEESMDPIGDHLKSPVRGIVHRYPDRVLLKIIGVCPVYCRFCFRRDMIGPHQAENLTEEQIDQALDYIKENTKIWEVIFTGGDPFMLSERRIRELLNKIQKISHVKILRWHTRVPFVDPPKITPSFVNSLKVSNKTVVVSVHVNHPNEFSSDAKSALSQLSEAGIPLVSQTVLLRDVNDNIETMEELMRACLEARILPYYLHHPDLARGTKHFRVSISQGLDIMKELHRRLSKIACPDYVIDLPGAYGKVSLLSSNVQPYEDAYLIKDAEGQIHTYRDAI